MISELRNDFNRQWNVGRYRRLLERLDSLLRRACQLQVCETPVFIPAELIRLMEQSGGEMMEQLVGNAVWPPRPYPARFKVSREDPHPLFAAVDFGIEKKPTAGDSGYSAGDASDGYQPVLCQEYASGLSEMPPGWMPTTTGCFSGPRSSGTGRRKNYFDGN